MPLEVKFSTYPSGLWTPRAQAILYCTIYMSLIYTAMVSCQNRGESSESAIYKFHHCAQQVALPNTIRRNKHTNEVYERQGDSEGREKEDLTHVHTLT